ncbi:MULTISPECIES: hypothetical protein [unclassified Sphingomonas]|uniref:hypothetical protein n=1 Tax=unclassified Sphingomonas TaxID=196159 RepID=UPI000833466D|nr:MULTISPECIES: hypothetical protein [unclassified Sphingomonas]
MRTLVAMMAGAALLLPVSAQAMSVAEFLAKANALKAKGFLAIGSSDIKLLRTEVERASDAYRSDLASAKAAGRAPHSCPPPKGKAKIGSNELLAEFEAIPAAKRNISVKTAFYAMMKKRFPCKG